MLRLGIIGFPLEHSLSPLMHTTALQNLNIVGEYKAYEIKEDNFEKKVKQLIASGLHGFNVTIPYKTRIIPLLDKLTKEAELAQAVNTVTIDKTGITTGSNTDITGFFEAIPEDIRKKIKETNVVVLGNGGAARAVCIAFLLNGIKRIKIYGRSKEKLERFKEFLTDRKNKLRTNTNIEVETCHGMSLPVMMIWPIYTANFIETLSDEIINQIKNGIDIATFFSSNTVGCFGVLAEKYNLKKHIQAIAVIGDETAKRAKDIFGKVDIVAKPATEEDLIVGVCHWYA